MAKVRPTVLRLIICTLKYFDEPKSLTYAIVSISPTVADVTQHTQANAIDFVDHIIEKFPFRTKEIRTDNGHEFQAKFHWHVEDLGIRHASIKRATPQLNGKVERSHRSDEQEFYQLLSYKGDVDLVAKLDEWERFYNFHRPHGAFNGKTPYEALREKLQQPDSMSPS